MRDLFNTEQSADTYVDAKPVQAPSLYEIAARKILGKGSDWELHAWDASLKGDAIKVTGDVPRILGNGKRVWPKGKGDSVLVTTQNVADARVEWERENGKCSQCGGDGLQFTGWSKTHGHRYKECTRCGGNGREVRHA